MKIDMTIMPALFIGDGSSMNTLEDNGYTRGMAQARARAAATARMPVIAGALVHRRNRGNRHGTPAYDSRLLWLSR